MFKANPLHGDASQVAAYRQADNYSHTAYRQSESADYQNQFGGRMAAMCGIGEYTEAKFAAMLNGEFGDQPEFHPTRRRGEYKTLTKEARDVRIGMELNYAPPKSVSLAGLLLEDRRAIEAHLEACRKTNEWIEQNLLEARMTLDEVRELQSQGFDIEFNVVDKKRNMCRVRVDSGWLAVSVLHTVSRLNKDGTGGGDCQIHSHDTVGTHTYFGGKLRALDFGKLLKHQHLCDAIYKTHLRSALEKSGVPTYDTKDGFEIEGFTREDVLAFSDGQARIQDFIVRENEARLDPRHPQHGQFLDITNSRHAQYANDATRGRKDFFAEHGEAGLSMDVAQAWWRAKAASRGVDVAAMEKRVLDAQKAAADASANASPKAQENDFHHQEESKNAEQHIKKYRRGPPPAARGRLRYMSELSLAQDESGDEVLLPGHVHGGVVLNEVHGEGPNPQLRRDDDGARGPVIERKLTDTRPELEPEVERSAVPARSVSKVEKVGANEALERAANHLTERLSVIGTDLHLLLHTIKFANHSIPIDELEGKISERVRSGYLVRRADDETLTTKHRIDTENGIKKIFADAVGKFKPIAEKAFIMEWVSRYQAEKGFNLSDDQLAAVIAVLTSEDGFPIMIGRAGTGKSTSMELCKLVIQSMEGRIFGLAPSGQAVAALSDSVSDEFVPGADPNAVRAHVITSQAAAVDERWWAKNCSEPGQKIVILDEAALVGNDDLILIMQHAQTHGARVVLSGDPAQYASVGAGSGVEMLEELAESLGSTSVTLKEMLRARDAETRNLHYKSIDDVEQAFVDLYKAGRLVQRDTADDCIEQIAEEYAALMPEQREASFVITSTNQDRVKLNAAIKAKLGLDSGNGIEICAYERDSNWTVADLECATNYEPDKTVFFNLKSGPFKKGEALRVVEVVNRRTVTLERTIEGEGEEPLKELIALDTVEHGKSISLGVEENIILSKGERIKFTAANKGLKIKNGDSGVVEGIDFERRIFRVRMIGSGRVVNFPVPLNSRGVGVRCGFAATGHSSQGGTAKNGVVFRLAPLEARIDRNSFYTDLTRSVKDLAGSDGSVKQSFRLFTNAIGADAIGKMMKDAGTALRMDMAMEAPDPETITVKDAFTDSCGIKTIYSQGKNGALSREEYELERLGLINQIKSAAGQFASKIGLRGSTAFCQRVIRTIVEERLDDAGIEIINRNQKLLAFKEKLVNERAAKDAEHIAKLKESLVQTEQYEREDVPPFAGQRRVDLFGRGRTPKPKNNDLALGQKSDLPKAPMRDTPSPFN